MNAADIVVRSSAILVAGLGTHLLLARRSAALRHLVLAGSIFLSAAVVPLSLALPSWDVQLPTWPRHQPTVSVVTIETTASVVNASRTPQGFDVTTILVMCWAAGSAMTALD